MSKKLKILAGAEHPGSANTIIPTIKTLQANGEEVYILKPTEAVQALYDKNNLKVTHDSFEDLSADLILTGTAFERDKVNLEQKLLKLGKERNIPTLAVLDFWNNYKERFTVDGEILSPTKIAIMDEYAKKGMLDAGFSEEILEVTGQPAFDHLKNLAANFTETDKENVKRKLASKRVLVTHCLHTDAGLSRYEYGFNDDMVVASVLDAMQKWNDVTYVLRAHPRELDKQRDTYNPGKFEYYRYLASKAGVDVVVQGDVTTDEACLASDLVVGVFSTMLVNCAYMDLNHVSLSPYSKKDLNELLITRKLGVTPYADTFAESVELVKKALFDEQYKEEQAVKRSTFKTDGKAGERVTKLVYDLFK